MRQRLQAGNRNFEQILPKELKKGDTFFELGRGGQLVEGTVTSDVMKYAYEKNQSSFSAKATGNDKEIFFNVINEVNNQIKLFKEIK